MNCNAEPTPWSRVLLEKLTVVQFIQKYPTSYGTRRLVLRSQEPATGPVEFVPHPHKLFLYQKLQLTPQNRVLLQKLTIVYGTQKLTTTFTRIM
jgi:hypothetical protein